MAIERRLGLIFVTAALLAVTIGCGSHEPAPGGGVATGAAAKTEEGTQKKVGTTLQNGRQMTDAEKGAVMSAKGHGEP